MQGRPGCRGLSDIGIGIGIASSCWQLQLVPGWRRAAAVPHDIRWRPSHPQGSDLSFVNESMRCHNGVNFVGVSLQKMGPGEPCKTGNPAEGRCAVIGGDYGFWACLKSMKKAVFQGRPQLSIAPRCAAGAQVWLCR